MDRYTADITVSCLLEVQTQAQRQGHMPKTWLGVDGENRVEGLVAQFVLEAEDRVKRLPSD